MDFQAKSRQIAAIVFVGLITAGVVAPVPSRAAPKRPSPRHVFIGKWEVKITHFKDGENDFGDSLHIARRGQVEDGWHVSEPSIYLDTPAPDAHGVSPGTDLNGNGIPDLVISTYGGGSICCTSIYVLELGDTVRMLEEWHFGRGSVVEVRDLDHDGRPELVVSEVLGAFDTACSNAGTPGGRVILSWRDGRFCPVPKLMRAKPDPKWLRLLPAVLESNAEPGGSNMAFAPCEAWQAVVSYLYTGNEALAARFLVEGWPWYHLGGVCFLFELHDQLQRRLITECQRPHLVTEPGDEG